MEHSTLSNETMDITCGDNAKLENNEIEDLVKLREQLRQELHETKKETERNVQMTIEMEVELEKLGSLTSKFELELSELNTAWSERLHNVKTAFDDEREQYASLHKALEKKLEELRQKSIKEDTAFSIEETVCPEELEIEELKLQLHKKKEEKCRLEQRHDEMTKIMNELEHEIKELKDSLQSESASLETTLKALEEMEEEKALLSSELAMLKAGPVPEGKEVNSLYSEIEDKRAKVENKLSVLYQKYVDSQRSLASIDKELEKEKREMIEFKLLHGEKESNLKAIEASLIENYQKRITELNEKISELEVLSKSCKVITIHENDPSNLEWVNVVVNDARAEARKLRNALDSKANENIFGEQKMKKLLSELNYLNAELYKEKKVTEYLESKKESLDKPKTPEIPPESLESDQENKKPVKTIRFASDVKDSS